MMKQLDLFPARDNGLVMVNHDQVVTTSLVVSEYFGKRHSDVLRAIKRLECSGQFHQRNFASMVEMKKLPQGGATKKEFYYLTRDGFTLLAMGFTGKIAAKFKEAYINAFNEMEEMLRKQECTRYAEKMFHDRVKAFNREIKSAASDGRHAAYDGLQPGIFYLDGLGLEDNLRNVFAQVQNAYVSGMNAAARLYQKERELQSLKQDIRSFAESVRSKVDIY